MDLVLCHTTADFDALGAAVGLTRLRPGARVVLTGGAHPAVRDFLALHRDEYALIERRSVNPKQIRSLMVVDTQQRDRLGVASEWLDLPHLTEIVLYDHHVHAQMDIPATRSHIEPVGATTTLIVEQLQQLAEEQRSRGAEEQKKAIIYSPTPPLPHAPTLPRPHSPAPPLSRSSPHFLTPAEATVMALGIHVDTGSLTFDHSTPRDALALAWLMAQGASLSVIADYIDPGLSPKLQGLLTVALETLQTETLWGYKVAWVLLDTDSFIPGLSSLASRLVELTESDALLLAARYPVGEGVEVRSQKAKVKSQEELVANPKSDERLTVIGRSQIESTNLHQLFESWGGGGHSKAASLTLRSSDPKLDFIQLVEQLKQQIPQPPTARELMSSPVRTIRPETTIEQAQRILLRYGHSGLSVVNPHDQLVGIISRRDIDIALHHGFSHAPVKGYMTTNLKTITPQTPLPEIELLMVTYDIGRLPVLENGQLVGIVTRTDVLRQLHQDKERGRAGEPESGRAREFLYCPWPQSIELLVRDRIAPPLWQLLTAAAKQAQERGWHLYLVGGAVRDLLLANLTSESQLGKLLEAPLLLQDIDLVVDGALSSATQGAGVELARALQQLYPDARLEVHGQFQTAALLWHKDPVLGSLWVDIATARTEFYPYPAANPEVEASSIRQDLYRRDFTINAIAARLTSPRAGELLDFFGGLLDLQAKQIRVLHANSFIEDPTRIYRAVRFAARLGFQIDPQTEGYIRNAIASGIYEQVQQKNGRAPALEMRLKSELKYILQAPYWKVALQLLGDLGALRCIHPTLQLEDCLWWQVRFVDRCLQRFDLQQTLSHWQLRLEVLIAYLAPEYRGKVATNLQLPDDSINRLQQLAQAQAKVVVALPKCDRPSEIVQMLRQYELSSLILIAVQSPRTVRRQIWRYLTCWSQIKAPLNGNDLKALGYKPGHQFKEILDALLVATLDGVLSSSATSPQEIRAEAESFLAKHFPLTDQER